jgi:hypothetical protein
LRRQVNDGGSEARLEGVYPSPVPRVLEDDRIEARASLTWAQQFFWFDHFALGREHRRLLNLLTYIVIEPHRDVSAVQSAVDAVVARHETLRTRFGISSDGLPIQAALRPGPGLLTVDAATAASEAEGRQWIEAFGTPDLDIGCDGPCRAGLVTVPDGLQVLVLQINHIAIDMAGLVVLERELSGLLNLGPAPPGADVPAWSPLRQADAESARDATVALEHWRRIYEATPAQMFVRTAAAPAQSPNFMRYLLRHTDLGVVSQAAARKYRTTPGAVWLAAYSIALAAASGQTRCAVITAVSNRGRPELVRAVGCVFQPGVLSVDVSGDLTLAGFLRAVTEASVSAQRHASYPFFLRKEIEASVATERGVAIRWAVDFNFVAGSADLAPAHEPPSGEAADTFVMAPQVREDDLSDVYLWVRTAGQRVDLELLVNLMAMSVDHGRAALDGICDIVRMLAVEDCADLTVAEVLERLPLRPTELGPEWMKVDRDWVNRSQLAAALCRHPAVASVDVAVERSPGGAPDCLTVTADVCDTGVSAADLQRHVRDQLSDGGGLMVPHRVILRVREDASDRGDLHPWVAAAERLRALQAAIQRFHANASTDGSLTYLAAGGRAVTSNAVIGDLRASGYTGLSPHDLLSPTSLEGLARRLVPADD